MKKSAFFPVFLILVLLITGCMGKTQILGGWLTSERFNLADLTVTALFFRDDGSGIAVGEEGHRSFMYDMTSDTLTFQFEDNSYGIGYRIFADKLTIGKGDNSVAFSRTPYSYGG